MHELIPFFRSLRGTAQNMTFQGLGLSSFYGGMMGHPGQWFWPGVWNMGILQAAMGRGISGLAIVFLWIGARWG